MRSNISYETCYIKNMTDDRWVMPIKRNTYQEFVLEAVAAADSVLVGAAFRLPVVQMSGVGVETWDVEALMHVVVGV